MLDFPSPLRPFIFQLINENNFRQILRFDNAQGGKKKKYLQDAQVKSNLRQ